MKVICFLRFDLSSYFWDPS